MVSFSCLYSKLIDENMILLLMVINVMTYLKFKLIEEEQIDLNIFSGNIIIYNYKNKK